MGCLRVFTNSSNIPHEKCPLRLFLSGRQGERRRITSKTRLPDSGSGGRCRRPYLRACRIWGCRDVRNTLLTADTQSHPSHPIWYGTHVLAGSPACGFQSGSGANRGVEGEPLCSGRTDLSGGCVQFPWTYNHRRMCLSGKTRCKAASPVFLWSSGMASGKISFRRPLCGFRAPPGSSSDEAGGGETGGCVHPKTYAEQPLGAAPGNLRSDLWMPGRKKFFLEPI